MGLENSTAALEARLARGQRNLEEIGAEDGIERALNADSPATALAELAAGGEADEIHETDRRVVIVPGPRES